MPRILITCPDTGFEVPTGYRSPAFDLATMTEPRAFRCPCGHVHAWGRESARLEEGLALAATRGARAA